MILPFVRDNNSLTNCNPMEREAPVTTKIAEGSLLRAVAAGEGVLFGMLILL